MSAERLDEGPRVLIVGDSQIFGLGTDGTTIGTVAAERVGATAVLDLSEVSKTVADAVADADRIRAFRPSVAVMCCGGTESLVHAGPFVQRLIERWAPPTWHGVNGLDPRPYYSNRLRRRIRQRITSGLKVGVKRIVIRATGGQRRIPADELRQSLEALLALLDEIDCLAVLVSMWRTDDRLFPRTGAAMAETQAILSDCVAGRLNAVLVDVWEELDYWSDFQADHLHFNETGHRRIGGLVAQAVQAAARSPELVGRIRRAPAPLLTRMEGPRARPGARSVAPPAGHPTDRV